MMELPRWSPVFDATFAALEREWSEGMLRPGFLQPVGTSLLPQSILFMIAMENRRVEFTFSVSPVCCSEGNKMATTAERSCESNPTSTLHSLQDIVSETERIPRSPDSESALPTVVTAQLVNFTDTGPQVRIRNHTELPARATVPLSRDQIGCEVVLAFANGDPLRPIIIGVLDQQTLAVEPASEEPADEEATAYVDGERVVLEGKKEIVLKCGKASITLTRAGKVLIKGAYVSSRSTGVQRIRGGSVHIN